MLSHQPTSAPNRFPPARVPAYPLHTNPVYPGACVCLLGGIYSRAANESISTSVFSSYFFHKEGMFNLPSPTSP